MDEKKDKLSKYKELGKDMFEIELPKEFEDDEGGSVRVKVTPKGFFHIRIWEAGTCISIQEIKTILGIMEKRKKEYKSEWKEIKVKGVGGE